MTKNGRPSRINDIRYFYGDAHSYLKGHDDAIAFGRRLAWFLNGEGYSLGAYSALYILLTPSLEPGAVQVTNCGGDWWQRYANVGVEPDFQKRLDASEVVARVTISALKIIRGDLASVVDGAEKTVRSCGDDLRFLVKTRQTKHFIVDISCNIPVWPQPSYLFTSLTDRSNGAFLEAPPLPIGFYDSAFEYNGPIKITEIKKSISDFVPRTRPVFSKMVKR